MADAIIIDRGKAYQTIEGFGVSGAWWAQMVGGWTHKDGESGLPVRERIAQLLFDTEKGIGIGIYRYNLGAGSAESGKGTFWKEIRRAESFDISDTEYDWTKDANAVWMLKEAVRLGVGDVVFLSILPLSASQKTTRHSSIFPLPKI